VTETEYFIHTFKRILERCAKKFKEREKRHGNTWMLEDIERLKDKLEEEFEEWMKADSDISEIIDIINVALMLAERLNESEEG
jgi:hypothetical protein